MSRHATLPLWESATPVERIEILRRMVDDLYSYVLGESTRHLIAVLERHEPDSSEETKNVQFIVEMARKHPNILSKTCEEGHITSSALVANLTGPSARILLNYHAVLKKWLPFGGHGESELAPWQTALREAREESGLPDLRFFPQEGDPKPIDIDVHVIPRTRACPEHYHLDFRYLLLTERPDLAEPSLESAKIRWTTFSEAMGLELEENTKRFIAKCREILSATERDSETTGSAR